MVILLLSLVPLSPLWGTKKSRSINTADARLVQSRIKPLSAACFWDPLRRKRVGPKVFFFRDKRRVVCCRLNKKNETLANNNRGTSVRVRPFTTLSGRNWELFWDVRHLWNLLILGKVMLTSLNCSKREEVTLSRLVNSIFWRFPKNEC